MYPDSDFTELKLVVPNIYILLVLAVNVKCTLLTFLKSWQPYLILNIYIVHSQPSFKALYKLKKSNKISKNLKKSKILKKSKNFKKSKISKKSTFSKNLNFQKNEKNKKS